MPHSRFHAPLVVAAAIARLVAGCGAAPGATPDAGPGGTADAGHGGPAYSGPSTWPTPGEAIWVPAVTEPTLTTGNQGPTVDRTQSLSAADADALVRTLQG